MTIKQTTKPLRLKFMDHTENFEFCIGNLSLQGINGILGRDWLSKHNPYIYYEKNHIFFLSKHCGSHCPSARRNNFLAQHSDISAAMVEEESTITDTTITTTDSIIPIEAISENVLIEDLCCAMIYNSKEAKQEINNEEIIEKYYSS